MTQPGIPGTPVGFFMSPNGQPISRIITVPGPPGPSGASTIAEVTGLQEALDTINAAITALQSQS